MRPFLRLFSLPLIALVALTASVRAERQMENLGRGVVAINQGSGKVHVGWRLLGTDVDALAFNLYRVTDNGAPVRLNPTPLTQTTDFVDTGVDTSKANAWFVRPVLAGAEQAASTSFTLPAGAPTRAYVSIPLQTLPGHVTNDVSAGDLDGDGEFELVVKQEMTPRDNSQSGFTGETKLEAYKLDGTLLWRINLGKNIREGAHYTQFLVYDFDGDGRAEVVCKTADGTIDGEGHVIGDASADWRNSAGYVLTGPEFLTVFDGRTGAALATTGYVPARNNDPLSPDVSAWGDNYGNRVDRFLAGVAYLDGVHPSIVMCRGYYTRTTLVAWDWRDGRLTQRWKFDTRTEANPRSAAPGFSNWEEMGNHQLSVADVDEDGRDEIVYGAIVVDDDGHGLYTTTRGHGDAFHVSKMDPDRPGLQAYGPHESPSLYGIAGSEMRDAGTGEIIWSADGQGADVGRGCAFDIDPRYRGYEGWSARGGLYSVKGQLITNSRPSQMNFGVWWDADPLRELLDGTTISKWDWVNSRANTMLTASGSSSNNSTKATPCLSADLFGDWREEIIWRSSDNRELRIYSTTIPATNRLYTLMHDPQYRLAIAWQNVGYNQPPHPGFYLGDGMDAPPRPRISVARPRIVSPPAAVSAASGAPATFSVAADSAAPLAYQWLANGQPIDGATAATLTIDSVTPADAGQYSARVTDSVWTVTSAPAVLSVATAAKVTGDATETNPDVHHPNGRIYDQVLLQGTSAAVTADPDQVLRISYIDLSNDIVQVEFAGAGTLALTLDNSSGPALPANYNQPINYMKGHAGIVITGANETTNVSVFSVGRATAVNQALFRNDVTYDGHADIAFIAISSTNGKFGGVRTANANYFATKGLTGIYAPGIQFLGPVFVGDLSASDAAKPVLVLGSCDDVRITGGSLLQANGQPVAVDGLTHLSFTAGTTSHDVYVPAQTNQARLEQNGVNVTAQVLANPMP